ncbi:hypothetical protein [Shewanella halotolerans]|uniref:hypothetical protein n=1 Tax=Shewanella halotolerans TaxID=2864204 RepID=UPI001C656560|nr:hypothetical protein [Shewanella halotolerans]QYJ88214.1 hypothetical protein K0H81_10240 [Shewanella halotolerans]
MRFIVIFLALLSFELFGKTIVIGPPDGYTFFWAFEPKTKFEENAFEAVKQHLAKNNGDVSNYYLSKNKLNVAKAVYEFRVKHHSEFRKSKNVMYMPFLSGTFTYDVKSKVVTFIRE